MVLKRSKRHKRQAKQKPTLPPSEPYTPPQRNQLEHRFWKEMLDNGDWIEIHAWYYPRKGNSRKQPKIADFYIAYRQQVGGLAAREGRLIASADCLYHGTFHLHDEVNDSEHVTREDVHIIANPGDVNDAFAESNDKIQEFARRIIEKEGRHRAN